MKNFLERIFILFIVSLYSSSIVFAQSSDLRIDSRERVTVQFKLFNNLVMLQGSFNGSDTLNLILDTGVKNSIILNKEIGDQLNLDYGRSVNLLGTGSDQVISALVVDSSHLDLYGVSGNIRNLLVLEEDYLQLKENFGAEIHGILGSDIFRRFLVKIDYVSHNITFYKPSSYKPGRWYTKIPVEIMNGKPYIDMVVKNNDGAGFKTKLLLDLGASHSALFELGTHDSLSLPENYITCSLGRGLGGEIIGHKARIKHVLLDEFRLDNVIVSYTNPYIHIADSSDIYRHGTLGAEVIMRFTVVIDYFNECLYLRKNKFYKSSFEYNMSGIDLLVRGKNLNLFYISNVAVNSPAEEAGAQRGDLILSINGSKTKRYTIDDLQRLFHSRNKKWIRIEALRDNRLVEYKFRLRRDL